MKIPFDIKFRPQIESGEYKLETTNGKSVRVICWNRSTKFQVFPIVALVMDGVFEEPFIYGVDGFESTGKKENNLLIVTTEPELSEFDKGYIRIVHKMKPEDFNDEGLKIAKEEAAELLELAKDEIYSHESLVEYAKTAREEGKAEALKNLPRWRVADKPIYGYGGMYIVRKEYGGLVKHSASEVVQEGDEYIVINDLEKLPGLND